LADRSRAAGPDTGQGPGMEYCRPPAGCSQSMVTGRLRRPELTVRVLPAQADEFTCASCFLVRHRSQVAREKGGLLYCADCEG
jgi:hypothetical protein